jgi:hypothetical protein
MVWNQPPALMGLALYICLASLPLGVQGVELQVEVMFGGFAGVDGAASQLSGLSHGPPPLTAECLPLADQRSVGRSSWLR